jgi:hypothetical protein
VCGHCRIVSLRWARRKPTAAQVVVCIVVASALPAEVFRVLDKMVEGDAKVKPAFVLSTVKAEFPQLDSALHKNVKKRVNTKKQQLKNKEACLR